MRVAADRGGLGGGTCIGGERNWTERAIDEWQRAFHH